MKTIRTTLLLLSALLLMLGHGAKIGFCPCHQSLFLYDCGCTGVEQTVCSDSCSSSCSHGGDTLATTTDHHTPSPSLPDQEDHDCGNITADTSPYFYVFGQNTPVFPLFSPEAILLPELDIPQLSSVWVHYILPYSNGPPPDGTPPYNGHFLPLLI